MCRYVARVYGKLIINEKELPDHQKTIKPVKIGGAAGGVKFVAASGILFKFSLDCYGLYNGDEGAMKSAGAELKGLREVFECQVSGIHVRNETKRNKTYQAKELSTYQTSINQSINAHLTKPIRVALVV